MTKKGFSLLSEMRTHERITIPLIISGIVIAIISFVDIKTFESAFTIDFNQTIDMFFNDNFVMLGILSIFLYELVPSAFRLLGTAGFFVGLLESGISPLFLILVTALGRLFGQYVLYLIGRLLFKVIHMKKQELANAEHLMHKYKFLIFPLIPFLGVLGDIIMIIAGHQRLGFAKLAPILFISNGLRTGIWLFWFMGQLSLPDILG